MVKKAILKFKIRKSGGDFTAFMTRKDNSADIEALLKYAAKEANEKQRKVMSLR